MLGSGVPYHGVTSAMTGCTMKRKSGKRSSGTDSRKKKESKGRADEAGRQFEFTVIAGELKGCKITSPDLGITRPPLSRLRKSIFDFLNPYLEEANYLDLFSGTGSYLFEAVSRHAAHSVGVELDRRLAERINQQARAFGVDHRLTCLTGDVLEVLPQLAAKAVRFDIIMIAPPQYRGIINETLRVLRDHALLSRDGLILCQHDSSETDELDLSGFALVQRRKYGNTTFSVLGWQA